MDPQLLTNIILIVGLVAVGYDRYKSGTSTTAKETISILKDQNQALKEKLVMQKAEHDTAIAEMKATQATSDAKFLAELNTLKAQLDHMKETNTILTNTVTGKETLIAITEVLKPIPALFAPGGILETFQVNQQKMFKELAEIKKALKESPLIPGPEDRDFTKRSPTIKPV